MSQQWEKFWCKQARGNPMLKVVVGTKTQSQPQDFYEVRQPDIHSTLWRGNIFKNYGTDQQRLQISELHFDKFLTPHTFSCWKIRFKTEVRFCSNFPKEAKRWIKEVKMVNSVDDLESLCSIQRTNPFPDFEVLDARIASALNKIIQNSCFKKEVSLEEQKVLKANQFLRGKQIAYLIYDYFQVTGVNDSVIDYADLWAVVLRNDNIQEFDRRRDEHFIVNGAISNLMTSWKVCTNEEYEPLRKSRPCWKCTTWRFITKKRNLIITGWRQL